MRIRLGLPLLGKELIEQSARRRTYVVRVLYATLLFFVAYLLFHSTLSEGVASPFAVLGKGREMFDWLVFLQFIGVYLFMPAMTCGVLTQEKERNSLALLFLTRLGPWTILFEKLLGRVVPMICFLLLSLPLLAFAYSLGGITPEYLWKSVWLLVLTVIQVGTLALACSAFFRTTVAAFIGTYLFGLVLYLGPAILLVLVLAVTRGMGGSGFEMWILQQGMTSRPVQVAFPFFGLLQAVDIEGLLWGMSRVNFVPPGGGGAAGGINLGELVFQTSTMVMSSGLFLLLARAFVVRRAFLPPRNIVLALFKSLDRFFTRVNNNALTRGIVLIPDKSVLPEFAPVAWRETVKRSLGRSRYLFRIFMVIEVPVAGILLLMATAGRDANLSGVSSMLFLLWGVAALIVSVQSASLIAAERTYQTLEVLCTTPLAGRDILLQKMRGVSRVLLVLLVPFFSIFLFEAWWRSTVASYENSYRWGGYSEVFPVPLYFVCSALSVGIYLPLVAWLSLLIGLVVRTQARAIIGAVAAIVGWCVLPIVVIVIPLAIFHRSYGAGGRTIEQVLPYFALLSPATIIPLNEFGDMSTFGDVPWVAIILNFLGYGFALFVIRQTCLSLADRLLGRSEGVTAYEMEVRDARLQVTRRKSQTVNAETTGG